MKSLGLRLVPLVIFVSSLLGACGADENSAESGLSNDIVGSVNEWTISTSASAAKAGEVKFTITNDGTLGHEFLVVKTDIALGEIPLDGDRFPEPSPGVEMINEIGEYEAGTTETLTVYLDAGTYQLVFNMPNHYKNGMYIAFEVVN